MPDDRAAVRARLGPVPFATHSRVEILAGEPGVGRARIPDAPELTNHIDSVHAGALFTLGETASGATMVGAFADLLASVRPVTRQSEIRYLKIARGEVTAHATLAEPVAAIRGRLEAQGRVDFDVAVSLTNAAGEAVAAMTVTWNLAKRAAQA